MYAVSTSHLTRYRVCVCRVCNCNQSINQSMGMLSKREKTLIIYLYILCVCVKLTWQINSVSSIQLSVGVITVEGRFFQQKNMVRYVCRSVKWSTRRETRENNRRAEGEAEKPIAVWEQIWWRSTRGKRRLHSQILYTTANYRRGIIFTE